MIHNNCCNSCNQCVFLRVLLALCVRKIAPITPARCTFFFIVTELCSLFRFPCIFKDRYQCVPSIERCSLVNTTVITMILNGQNVLRLRPDCDKIFYLEFAQYIWSFSGSLRKFMRSSSHGTDLCIWFEKVSRCSRHRIFCYLEFINVALKIFHSKKTSANLDTSRDVTNSKFDLFCPKAPFETDV